MLLPLGAVHGEQTGAQETVQKSIREHFAGVLLRSEHCLNVGRFEKYERGYDGDPDANAPSVAAECVRYVVAENWT